MTIPKWPEWYPFQEPFFVVLHKSVLKRDQKPTAQLSIPVQVIQVGQPLPILCAVHNGPVLQLVGRYPPGPEFDQFGLGRGQGQVIVVLAQFSCQFKQVFVPLSLSFPDSL
jgi:hypothetical protein